MRPNATLVKVRINKAGYEAGKFGSYYGAGLPLYRMTFEPDGSKEIITREVRAESRAAAMVKLLGIYWNHDLRFRGGPKKLDCVECGEKVNPENWCESTASDLRERSECFSCNFWLRYVRRKDEPNVVRATDGHHYIIGPEDDRPGCCRGHGGRKFVVRFTDGREVETTNLWHQGEIPERFRGRLPVNATVTGA
jgi:hypothetical protein